VVLGASAGADWKAELLASAGAKVVRLDDGWTEEQLVGAAIAVADLADPSERNRFAVVARGAGALVNLIDEPDGCDVQFGTIVNRSPVVIAISTGGAAPMLGQSIRTRIEAVLPRGLSSWALAARSWRPRLKQALTDFALRRDFWLRFVAATWNHPDHWPTEEDFTNLIEGKSESVGRLTVIGVDSLDAELLTLKAVRALQSATVILHDNVISAAILELARREASRIKTGAIGNGDHRGRSEVAALMIELVRNGEAVVRICDGRTLDEHMGIELGPCFKAGIDVSIVGCPVPLSTTELPQ
jgi:uroporphyrin-III C-methyltransferase/precorrin-2 dehydrogenase/sirohydrochlorin ferrochelatase